jgi:hypothetical protein
MVCLGGVPLDSKVSCGAMAKARAEATAEG